MILDVHIHALEAIQLSRFPSWFHGPNSVTAHHLHNIDNTHTFLRMHIVVLSENVLDADTNFKVALK